MTDRAMRALVLTRYGGPDVIALRTVPTPAPGPGECRVRVHAFGLNPVDTKTRDGKLRVIRRYPLPAVLGNELAGVVESAGAQVTRFQPGDRVMARVSKATMGAFAEYAVVHESLLARVPDVLPLEVAAGLPLAGLTALQCLRDELQARPGLDLLITGGAGGVGTLAIQLAKHFGCRVTTTASARGAALVTALGADAVIDYTTEGLAPFAGRFEATFDTVGGPGLHDALRATRRGGKLVTIAGPPEPRTARIDLARGAAMAALFWLASLRVRGVARACGVDYRYLFMHESGAELAELATLVTQGALRVVVDRTFAFAQSLEALAYLETGRAKGKVIVQVLQG